MCVQLILRTILNSIRVRLRDFRLEILVECSLQAKVHMLHFIPAPSAGCLYGMDNFNHSIATHLLFWIDIRPIYLSTGVKNDQ